MVAGTINTFQPYPTYKPSGGEWLGLDPTPPTNPPAASGSAMSRRIGRSQRSHDYALQEAVAHHLLQIKNTMVGPYLGSQRLNFENRSSIQPRKPLPTGLCPISPR